MGQPSDMDDHNRMTAHRPLPPVTAAPATNHPAQRAADIITRRGPGLVDDGYITADEGAALTRGAAILHWIAQHADTLRRLGAGKRPATDAEIAALKSHPAVAAAMAAFPGSAISTAPLAPIAPPDATTDTDPMGIETDPQHGGKV